MTAYGLVKFGFWCQIFILAYIYAGYPLLALCASRLRQRPIRKHDYEPTVTLIIAAHNESSHIAANLSNKLALDYPRNKLTILVVSDGSTDDTDDIVRTFAPDVQLVRQDPRRGKTAALNAAVQLAIGEIITIADGNSMYERDALRELVANFGDPSVGYVTGALTYHGESSIGLGSRAYMSYESALRQAETHLGSVVGVNGGIDAFRRELYTPLRDDELPDFALPLQVVSRGARVVYEPSAKLWEESHASGRAEYRMRVRVALRALWTIRDMRHMLNPWRFGMFSLQLISHKVLRYLSFPLLVGAYLCALVLHGEGPIYSSFLLGGFCIVVAAFVGMLLDRRGRRSPVFALPYFYLLVTAASGAALWSFIKGERITTWKPRLG